MFTFTLDQVDDVYKPKDLIDVTIQRVVNPHTNKKTNRFMIHINGDSFGLFSDKYVFCSTENIVNKLQEYEIEHYRYDNGFMTVYLKSKTNLKTWDGLNDEVMSVLSIINPDIKITDATITPGVFITNSYNGTKRLTIGSSMKIDYNQLSLFTKLNLYDFDSVHMSNLVTKMEEKLTLDQFNYKNIKQIDTNIAKEVIIGHLAKKQKKRMISILSSLPNYNTIHMLVICAYLDLPVQKEINILKDLSELL